MRGRRDADGAEKKRLNPQDTFRDCADCPEMVVVPAGDFLMGSPKTEDGHHSSEEPQRKVTIKKPFAVGKFEVTFAEWDACVAAKACKHKPSGNGWGRDRRPVIKVSWDDITKEYLPWLKATTGKTHRLLSEAEWEYAARVGTTGPFSFSGKTYRLLSEAEWEYAARVGTTGPFSFSGKITTEGELQRPL